MEVINALFSRRKESNHSFVGGIQTADAIFRPSATKMPTSLDEINIQSLTNSWNISDVILKPIGNNCSSQTEIREGDNHASPLLSLICNTTFPRMHLDSPQRAYLNLR